ncbi:flagellar biosynthetic protein FliO [Salipaludibacillus daqingensis]|uniref:flagellar biosynthetic protein FliO n=1 Tax=Salipaludibacillus daqingensis TaxID=3041001 RepID=UPI002473663E|nr:flagellar biosynthetic protein FliO [Salipaludibacillus daqingensis]
MIDIRRLFIILLFLSVFVSNEAYANDFGEGNRNVNQILDSVENDSDEDNDVPLQDTNEAEEDYNPTEDTEENKNQEEDDDSELGPAQNQNLLFLIFQMFLGLGAVLFVIYFLLKFINKRAQNFNSHSTVQNIGGAGVGSNKSVQVIRVGKRVLVVGVGDSVQLLKEIEDPNEIEEMIESTQQEDFFDQPISKVTGWLQKKKSDKNSNSNELAFRSLLDNEMKDVKKSQNKIHSALEEKD